MGATPLWQERAQEYARARAGTKTPPRLIAPVKAKGSKRVPPHKLLISDESKSKSNKHELYAKMLALQAFLAQYDIVGSVYRATPGPVITRYYFEPGEGVKVAQITAVERDIALRMAALSASVSLIPGTAAVGIDIANSDRKIVHLADCLDPSTLADNNGAVVSGLPLILGKSTNGKSRSALLDQLMHLLVAGQTGGGKSSFLKCALVNWLLLFKPGRIKFALVDPKRVEFPSFADLTDYLFCPVALSPEEAAYTLSKVVYEMGKRYDTLKDARKPNITEYNASGIGFMPYLVVIIDELADLMAQVRDKIETSLQRLAQLARAVGIHLVVATQHPSKEVITGVIKANFPAKIAFACSSQVASRVILDENGAENLLGRGDMLFLPPGAAVPERIHGAYVSSEEIERVVEYARNQN